MTATAPDLATIIERTKPRPPGKCHIVDHRGWALCGAFSPRYDGNGDQDRSHLHEVSDCRRWRHRRCVACDELDRQLGNDYRMSA